MVIASCYFVYLLSNWLVCREQTEFLGEEAWGTNRFRTWVPIIYVGQLVPFWELCSCPSQINILMLMLPVVASSTFSGLESDQDSFGDKSSFLRKPSHGSIGEERSPGLSFNSRSFSILHRRYVTNKKQWLPLNLSRFSILATDIFLANENQMGLSHQEQAWGDRKIAHKYIGHVLTTYHLLLKISSTTVPKIPFRCVPYRSAACCTVPLRSKM